MSIFKWKFSQQYKNPGGQARKLIINNIIVKRKQTKTSKCELLLQMLGSRIEMAYHIDNLSQMLHARIEGAGSTPTLWSGSRSKRILVV